MGETPVVAREADLMRTLHDEHAPALWGYALTLTNGDRGRAEDVVQETLLRAWRNPHVLDQSQRSARGWLFRVAHNIAVDDWRARKVRPEVVTAELPDQVTTDATEEIVQTWMVSDALARLSLAHRQVLLECYYAGRTVAQAAERIGVPEGTVKSRLHYALAALKLVLQEMGLGT
ncbi:MAG: sigma-70 family RNA polymerase sigma factor [Nocardioidaceae bacterium]